MSNTPPNSSSGQVSGQFSGQAGVNAGSRPNAGADVAGPYFLRGDFIVTAQAGAASPNASLPMRLGWSARPSAEEEGGGPFVYASGGNGPAGLLFRRAAGDPIEHAPAGLSGADVVQLERRGSTFILSAARFGEAFTAVRAEIDLGNELEVFLVGGDPEDIEDAAVFHNVRVVIPAAAGFNRQTDPFASRLEVLDIADGRRKIVYSTDTVIEAPNWTRDGAALIYNSGGRLYRFDLAGRTHTLIDTGDAVRNNNDHVISFDGAALAISSHDERGDSQVYTVPLAGGQARRVTPTGPSYLHGWSPDGKFLVYTGYRNGIFDIYRIGVEGGAETRLTTGPGLDDGPEYTPDGQYIYFNSTRSGRMQIWRMKPDGSEQEQITDDDCDNWFPHISPDGRSVVFLSYLPGEVEPHDHPAARRVYLRLMPAQGGSPRVIAYLYGGQGTINVPSWSPDSRRIAFVSNTVPLP